MCVFFLPLRKIKFYLKAMGKKVSELINFYEKKESKSTTSEIKKPKKIPIETRLEQNMSNVIEELKEKLADKKQKGGLKPEDCEYEYYY